MRRTFDDVGPLRSNELVRQPKPLLRAGAGGTTPVRYAKLAQIVNNELRCFVLTPNAATPPQVLEGNDLQTFATLDDVIWPVGTDYLCNGQPPVGPPQIGDVLEILDGPDAGSYQMLNFASCRQAQLDADMTANSGDYNLPWRIEVAPAVPAGTVWSVDYSQVIKARAIPGSGLHRYRPNLGPGDHTGSDLAATADSTTVTSAGADFEDTNNPVVPGMYLEITGGADAGRHQIASVPAGGTTLELVDALTATETGLAYRIDIVSEHATPVQLVSVGGTPIAVPDHDSIEVKIARPIRDETDATDFDTFRELGTTEAVDLFNEHGAYLACYRLDVEANEAGNPTDSRVIIAAKPWRGHSVPGVLFFDDNNDEKYDLSDPDEPVWPIRWYRDHWRLEIAVGFSTHQEPIILEIC